MKKFATSAAIDPVAIVEDAWQDAGASFERFCHSLLAGRIFPLDNVPIMFYIFPVSFPRRAVREPSLIGEGDAGPEIGASLRRRTITRDHRPHSLPARCGWNSLTG
jgi:hypothetical protein